MPRELLVTNTNFGGRPAEAAVAVKFVHNGFPRQKSPEKRANAGGPRRGGERQGVQYLAVLHLTSKGEGVSCPSNDIQDTTAYSWKKCVGQ